MAKDDDNEEFDELDDDFEDILNEEDDYEEDDDNEDSKSTETPYTQEQKPKDLSRIGIGVAALVLLAFGATYMVGTSSKQRAQTQLAQPVKKSLSPKANIDIVAKGSSTDAAQQAKVETKEIPVAETISSDEPNPMTEEDEANFEDLFAKFNDGNSADTAESQTPSAESTPSSQPDLSQNSSQEGLFGTIREVRSLFGSPQEATSSQQQSVIQVDQTGSMQKTLNQLNSQISENISEIQRLEDNIQTLNQNITKITQDIRSFDDKVTTINSSVNSLSEEMRVVKLTVSEDELQVTRDMAEASSQPSQTLTYTGPEYVVHAVIPGRAWLKSSHGQILTVSEGDTVGDYGKILVIDAANGVVLTSSGIAFR